MSIARLSPLTFALLVVTVGCADDDDTGGAGGQASTTATTGAPSSTGVGTSSSTAVSTTSATSSATSSGAGLASCGDDLSADDLRGGAWDTRFTVSGFTGHDGVAPGVFDFARDVDGSIVATGRFGWFEDAEAPPLMRWRNGAWAPARTTWEVPAPEDGFSAIAIATDGALALATNDSFGPRDGEIWIDAGSGLTSIGAFVGQVRSLAWHQGALWAAGIFQIGGSSGPANLAVWTGGAWVAPPGGAIVGDAYELMVDDDVLYVGGAFDEVGGLSAASVASFDGATWTPLDFVDAGENATVFALARTASGGLYAGGHYGAFQAASGIARWNGATWETVGGGLAQYQTRGVVADLVAHGETVDAIGCFSSAGGLEGAPGAIDTSGVARWTGAAWESLGSGGFALAPWFQPLACGDEGPGALWDVTHQRGLFDAGRLYVGGTFAGIGGTFSQSIAVQTGASWEAQGTSGLGLGGSLDRIAVGGDACDAVYGVGLVSHVAGVPARGRVLRFTGDAWEVLTDDLPVDAFCPSIDVDPNGEVAVGCMVFPPNGEAEGVILRRSGSTMVRANVPGLDVVSVVQWGPDGALWIGGGSAGGFVARLEGDTLTMIEDDITGNVGQLSVVAADDVIVGGTFGTIGGVPALHVARWNGSTWSALGDGVPGQPTALARSGDTIWVSSYDDGSGGFLLGQWDGNAWSELASPAANLTPVPDFNFNAIRPVQGGLVLVGSAFLDDDSGRGAVVYQDGTFRPLVGGVGAIGLGAIALTDDAAWVGGIVGQAGEEDGDWISTVGVARLGLRP